MTIREHTHAVRPLLFENSSDEFAYSRCGSCTLVACGGEYYAVVAAHQMKGFDHIQALIPYYPGSDMFLPLRESFVVLTTEHDDIDHKDIIFFSVWMGKLDFSVWRPDLVAFLDATCIERPSSDRKYVIAGYPTELNTPDYERAVIPIHAFLGSAKFTTANRFRCIDQITLDETPQLASFDGLSGGGAFSVDLAQTNIRFEGLILRATVESLACHVLRADAIYAYISRQQKGEQGLCWTTGWRLLSYQSPSQFEYHPLRSCSPPSCASA